MALAASGPPHSSYKKRFWWYFLLTILGVFCWLNTLVECTPGDIIGIRDTNVDNDVETRENHRHHFDPPQPPPKAAASAASMKSGKKNDDLSQNEENHHFEKVEMASGKHSKNEKVIEGVRMSTLKNKIVPCGSGLPTFDWLKID